LFLSGRSKKNSEKMGKRRYRSSEPWNKRPLKTYPGLGVI